MMNTQDIQTLIRLPKVIIDKKPADGYREENRTRRCDLDLQSSDETGRVFQVFIRQHIRIGQNFSIGLRYAVNREKLTTITLARYNGPHGEYSRAPDGHYALPHIHYMTEAEIEAGHSQPQENRRELTDRYATLEEALRVFFHDTETGNYATYFPELLEPRLFNGY